jgi:phosphotransferase system HPr (HPr) family protein
MVRRDMVVNSTVGLHARPAATLTKLANTFNSDIKIIHNDKTINAKDIWDILNAGIENKATITLICEGNDETVACDELEKIITMS